MRSGLVGSALIPNFKARAYLFTSYLQLASEANTQFE